MVRCYDLHAALFLSFPPPGRKDFFMPWEPYIAEYPEPPAVVQNEVREYLSGFLIPTTNSKIQGDYENERTFYRYHASQRRGKENQS